MLSSSLRRAAWAPFSSLSSIPRSSTSAASSSSNGLLGAAAVAVQPVHLHQRRYSSSKPPVPPSDGSRGIDTSSQTPAKSVGSSSSSSSGERGDGKATKRKGRDHSRHFGSSKSNQHAAFSNPPSVPSTQHLQPHAADVNVASFFSIHRPISITATVPPTSSAEAFNSLFSSKRSARTDPKDVIFSLSSAAHSLENAAAHEEDVNMLHENGSATYVDAEGDQFDGIGVSDMNVSVEEFAKRLRPFHPPPPPVPFGETQNVRTTAEQPKVRESKETSGYYSTVLTIRESTHADGGKTYEAQTSPFVRMDEMKSPPSADADASSIDNLDDSNVKYVEPPQENRSMHTISTKRRRKLKMKKHKYKKLLRRTRTLRHKLDKA